MKSRKSGRRDQSDLELQDSTQATDMPSEKRDKKGKKEKKSKKSKKDKKSRRQQEEQKDQPEPETAEEAVIKEEMEYEPVEKVNFELNPELFIGSIECIKLEKKMLACEYE